MGRAGKEFTGDGSAPKAAARQRIDDPRADGLHPGKDAATPFAEGEQSICPQPVDMVAQVDRLIACASDTMVWLPTIPGLEIDKPPPR